MTEDDHEFTVEPWIFMASAWTAILFLIGILLPPFVGMERPPAFGSAKHWFQTMFAAMSVIGFIAIIGMALRQEPKPWLTIRQHLDPQRLFSLIAGGLLVALNLAAFGFIKPLLGRLGFGADPLLAQIDIFILGDDAWRVFEWVRHPFIGEAYHAVWLAWIFLTVTILLWRRPSASKSRALATYFLLWSIFGPLVHIMFPAAGPVLSSALIGQGFEGLQVVTSDAQKFNYLLEGYRNAEFNFGGGISAMPSLHIATMAWTAWVWKGWVRSIAMVLTLYMWLASVALGWHYLIDGAVGILIVWVSMEIRLGTKRRNNCSPRD